MSTRSQQFYFDASYTSMVSSRSGVTRVVDRTWKEAKKKNWREGVINRVIERHGSFFESDEKPVTAKSWPLHFLGLSKKIQRKSEVSLTAGDILFLPDAYWAYPSIWPAVAHARQRGVHCVPLVYDLIPLKHPEIYGDEGVAMFRGYLKNLLLHADAVVTISQTVAEELERCLPEIVDIGDPPPIIPWKLGCDLPTVACSERRLRSNLFNQRLPESAYLVVGSIEPRKNHNFILDAFDRLWSTPATKNVRLAFVGTAGFKSEEILQRIKNHPENNHRLFFLTDLDDAALAAAYAGARGVVFASIAEGFGLPITEALAHSQKAFVSDLPIHREVGGADCEFFSLDTTDALFSCISKHEETFATTATPVYPHTTPISWQKSTAMLMDILNNHVAKPTIPLRFSA